MATRTLTVTYRPLADIKGAPRNPKGHDLAAIRASLQRFGLGDVAGIIDGRTKRLVAGHGRIACLTDMAATGDPPPQGVHLDNDGAWLVPMLEGARFLNAVEAEAFLIGHNRTTELGGWNPTELGATLEDHRANLTGTGYTIDDLPPPGTGDAGEDDPDLVTPPATPVSGPGSVWQLGRHRLVCGSSATPDAWSLLDPPKARLVFTDPPYGVDYEGGTKAKLTVPNDDLPLADLSALVGSAFDHALSATRPGGAWFVCAPPGPQFLLFAQLLTDLGIWRQTIVWAKNSLVLGHSDYHYLHEAIAVGAAPGAPTPLYDDLDQEAVIYGWAPGAAHQAPPNRRQTSVWEFPRPAASSVHPTMKPVELIAKAIRNHTRPGHDILDPFGGSGSTLIAAELTDRTAWLIELDPGYCDVIARRWQHTTGHQPIHNGQALTLEPAA